MPGIREHPTLFARLAHWLRPEGRLLLSLGGSDAEGFTSDMQGATFFYSGDEPATALAALVAAGFRLERWEVDDQSSRGHHRLAVRDDSGSTGRPRLASAHLMATATRWCRSWDRATQLEERAT